MRPGSASGEQTTVSLRATIRVVSAKALGNTDKLMAGRRQYPFHVIEPKWQKHWDDHQTFRAWNPGETVPSNHPFASRHAATPVEQVPKFYILDMFPYPSGDGLARRTSRRLHGDRYPGALQTRRRVQHVLHPMGWDAFGLPAEQYAIKTGQHPRKTTEQNVATFKRQIKSLGFSYDWSRELDTTDPDYFRWTQWIFLKLYNSWFNPATEKAEPMDTLPYPPELSRARPEKLERACLSRFQATRLRERSSSLVVRTARHRSGQRRSRGRQERSGRVSRRAQADASMDAPHHCLRGAVAARSRHNRMERFAQGNAAQLDWPQRRRGGRFCCSARRSIFSD